ncbi:hypothetical protein RBSWK_03344 [Rhodopirellula baltica SWK14]|uniref:Uncharacterized protein n=1 Tax=Rhodopirellula baltica SWK14 TaxID=993516 RepID=L7CEN1_RHOBT|nr:hypothetical protein RBSWK_03344 [Rhodopirellula baltica SWK14]
MPNRGLENQSTELVKTRWSLGLLILKWEDWSRHRRERLSEIISA